jgi:hypothetical protein
MHDARPKDKGTALVSCLLSTCTAAAFSADVSTILGGKKKKKTCPHVRRNSIFSHNGGQRFLGFLIIISFLPLAGWGGNGVIPYF